MIFIFPLIVIKIAEIIQNHIAVDVAHAVEIFHRLVQIDFRLVVVGNLHIGHGEAVVDEVFRNDVPDGIVQHQGFPVAFRAFYIHALPHVVFCQIEIGLRQLCRGGIVDGFFR